MLRLLEIWSFLTHTISALGISLFTWLILNLSLISVLQFVIKGILYFILNSELLTLNSYKWPRQNFSSQHQDHIKQTVKVEKENYQLGDYQLIPYQILQTYMLIRICVADSRENYKWDLGSERVLKVSDNVIGCCWAGIEKKFTQCQCNY